MLLSSSSRLGARFVASMRRSVAALAMVFVAVFVMAGLALPGVASAQSVTRTVSGTFGNGAGSFSGAYGYDPATRLLSNVNITLTEGAGRPAATMVSGYIYTNTDIVFCSSNPCTLPAEYIYVAAGETASAGDMFSGDCINIGAGSVTTGCNNGVVTRQGTYTQNLGPVVTLTGPGNLTEGDTGSGFSSWAITLNQAAVADVTVGYRTVAGTASTADFGSISGNFVIPAGTLGGSVNVYITGDTLDENDETFTFELTSVSANASLSPSASVAIGTIVDNDAAPSYTIGPVSQAEGNSGITSFTVPVSLTAASGKPTSISLFTTDDSATSGEDYVSVSPTLNFAPGETTKTFTLQVNGDTTLEGNERVRMGVSAYTDIVGTDEIFYITIENDDVPAPTVTGLSATAGPAAGGNTVIITGTNFTGSTGVTFGANAATSFTVDSATQITAVVPPLGQELVGGNTIGAEVSVTTAGGTSSTSGSADDYRYIGVPRAPNFHLLDQGGLYGVNQLDLKGSATGATSVEIFIDDASIGTTPVDPGNGEINDPGTDVFNRTSPVLSDGSHTIYAVAINAGGRSAPSVIFTITVDTTAPSVPVIISPVSGSVLKEITTVSGTGEPNTTVDVWINDGSDTGENPVETMKGGEANTERPPFYDFFGSAEVDSNGAWTVMRRRRVVSPDGESIGLGPQAIGETPISLYASGIDAARNESGISAIVTLTTDAVVPVTPTVTSPAPGATVNTVTPTFTGTGEPGSLITVYVDSTEWGQAFVDEAGNWTDGGNGVANKGGPSAGPRLALSAGPHTWFVTSEDRAGNLSAPTTPIGFVVVLVAIDQTSVPNGAVASAYSQTLTATGGTAPYGFAVTGGALPAGVTLSSGGVLSGTPTAGGAFNFTVTVTDSISQSASQAFSLAVSVPTIAATSTVPAGRRGFAYSQTLVGSGGTGPYTFALQSGALPAGITLTSGGVLSGTPTVIGSFPIGVLVTDSSTGTGPYSSTVNLTLVVNAATISVTPTTLPSVMAGLPFDQNLTATGGAGTYSYAVTGGALPSGITLTAAGRLAGRSYTVGAFNFTVTATDSFSNTGSVALVLSVVSRPDPSADPDVRGLDTAQAEATRRLIGTQTDNFARRLEQLNSGGGDQPLTNGLTFNAGISALGLQADPRNRLGGGRVFDRQTVDPDRAELDAMLWQTSDAAGSRQGSGNGGAPVGGLGLGQGGGSFGSLTIDDSQPGLNTGQAGGYAPAAPARGGARIWTGGSVTIGERDGETGQAEFNVRSSGVSMGADMALSPTLDLGFGGGFGEESAEIGQADTEVDTTSVVGVVYGSWRPEAGIHLDALIGFGQLDFDMQRRVSIDGSLVQGQREGDAVFGSLGLGFDRVVMTGRLNTYGRVETLNAELGAYTETGSPFWALSYEARDVESLQGVLGARYVWNYQMRDSVWTPSLRVELRREFADGGTQSLSYADWLGGPVYQIRSSGWDRSEFNLGLGLNRTGADGWTFATEAGARMSANEAAATLRLALSRKF